MIFFFGWKMKDDLSQEIHRNMILFVFMCKCYKYDITLLQKKNQRWSSPEKIHLNVIDILDVILERVPTILWTFTETFIGVFIYCCLVKKNPRNLTYRIEIWLLPQFFWLEIFYNEESSVLCTIQSSGVVLRGVLEHQLRKLFVH